MNPSSVMFSNGQSESRLRAVPFRPPETSTEHRARLRRLAVEGGDLAYVDEGPREGEPILLVHGMPDSSWSYRKAIPRLAEAGLRVVAPDLLGWGASDKPADPAEYTAERQAARLVALMTHLGFTQWTQVCHDLGGHWTFELLDREPTRISRLVVLNTTVYVDGWDPPSAIRLMRGPLGRLMVGAIASRLFGPRMLRSLLRTSVARPELITQPVVEGYWVPLREGATRPFHQVVRSFDTIIADFGRFQAALRRFTAPALVVWGGQDRVLDPVQIPGHFARDLRVPPERVHVLHGAGHFLQEDEPDTLARLIAEFVHATPARSAAPAAERQ